MATKKISELEAINAAEDNDVLVIVDTSESTTNKITKGNLLIGAGHTIEMTLNENYQIVLVLKNAAGTALSTQTIDLPNENAITNLAYNNGILTVTKQSGATSQINLTGLIEGLVTENDFNTFKEALQTTLEAINEKDAEQDEAIAENYKVINKLNEKLENQQKVINQLPQVPGQGTSITLENTIEAQFTKFDVEGNSVQDGTPSPDNEVPIYSAGDNENLFDKDNANILNVNLSSNTVISGDSPSNRTLYIPVQPNTTYTIQKAIGTVFTIGTTESTPTRNLAYSQRQSDATAKSLTITTNSTAQYLIVWFWVTSDTLTLQEMLDSIKIEQGSTATPYSPYGMGSINEKISNKNVISSENIDATFMGVKYLSQDNGTILANGTKYGGAYLNLTKNIVTLENDTYSSKIFLLNGSISKDGTNIRPTVYLINQADTSKSYSIGGIGNPGKSQLIEAGTYYLRIATWEDNAIFANAEIGIMLVKGSTIPTAYVPHEEQDYPIFVQQPMRSNKDKTIKDKFVVKSDNKKYERHYIGEVVLNGTEYWELLNSTSDYYEFITYNSLKPVAPSSYTFPMASHFGNATNNRCVANGNQLLIRVPASMNITNATEFKNWLQENNVTINYLLAEPLDLPCTPEQIQQLENKPSTYKDFTIINSEDETPAHLEVSGVYDLNKLITRTEVLESES